MTDIFGLLTRGQQLQGIKLCITHGTWYLIGLDDVVGQIVTTQLSLDCLETLLEPLHPIYALSARWHAISNEAALAAEHIAIGVTALGRANYVQQAYYNQALFSLSIGLERSCKLAIAIDHSLSNGGRFPTEQQVRDYGHGLRPLLTACDALAVARGLDREEHGRLLSTPIHASIVDVLHTFATNVTRYHNLDIITDAPRARQVAAPIAEWYTRVISPIRDEHLSAHRLRQIEAKATEVAAMMGDSAEVLYHTETGDTIDTVYEASLRTGITNDIRARCQLYPLQIGRFLYEVMSELNHASYAAGLSDVPHLTDYYGIYCNSDQYFLSRKTWSIHY
jgi:hypothetical protein